jgi:hypothetical protein
VTPDVRKLVALGAVVGPPVKLPGVPAPDPGCTEAAFLGAVLDLARRHGWYAAHFRPAMTKGGRWVTAVAGNGKGFPDLVLVRERVLFAELKSETGRPSPEQQEWLFRLMSANAGYFLWRPGDWPDIEAVLSAPPPAWWVSLVTAGGVTWPG